MAAWIAWAIAAALLAIGEILTPGMFFLGPVALAAVAAAHAAALGAGVIVQVIAFLAASVASLGLLRPVARRHVRLPSAIRTGTDALVGRTALVVARVDSDGGRVRIGGEEWSARSFFDGEVLEPGARAEVIKIEGATALVHQ